jgi:hypothetical protein
VADNTARAVPGPVAQLRLLRLGTAALRWNGYSK